MNLEATGQVIALIAISLLILFVFFTGEAFLRRRKQKEVTSMRVSKEGLVQFDDLPPGAAVLLAWSEAGDNPRWHRKMQEEVRAQMPILGRALDRMVEN